MPDLVLKNISKKYGNTQILRDINLQIEDGEFCMIVGPSGSGKTTLLNIIAGFIKPDSGEVIMDGNILNQLPPRDRSIGMVFQEYGLFSHMTVKRNISFGLEIKKCDKKDIDKRVIEITEKLKIRKLLDKKPGLLSGGEAQRVAIGRTLITDPLFYLFDEPLGNLDANLRLEMLAEIKRLHLNLKKTFVYVTHDQVQALSIASKVVIMKDGKVLQKGHPRDVYNNPGNLFVAEFFGAQSMNLINGTIVSEGRNSIFSGGGLKVELKGYPPPEEPEVVLGVKPEDVIILDKQAGNIKEDGVGKVSSFEFLGDSSLIYVNLEQEKPISIIAAPEIKLDSNEKVKIKFKENKIFLFSKKHGGRLYP
ncbi:MAG: ABC transporter ATP-binding protein [Actinomycetota bacterium]